MEQTNYMYGEYTLGDTAKVNQVYGDIVSISKAEYEDLLEDARWLACLNQAGVDNWDGYDFAQEIFEAFNG